MSAARGGSFFELCVRRPVLTSMMSLALVVFGLIGLDRLPVRELPDIDPAVVNVLTVYPGASAEVVEAELTERLEEAISSADGIKLLSSTSREQASSITVEFIQGSDVDIAAQDVRDRVARVRGELPDDIDEPVISKQDASASPIIWLNLTSDVYSTREITEIADRLVKDRLQTVPGVSGVVLAGEKKFAIRLRLNPELMAAHGVTVGDVESALREQNVELPSGRIENLQRELSIKMQGQFDTAAQFQRMIIRQDGGRIVRLEDVGVAEEGVEDERSLSRFNGKASLGLGIVRQSRANTVAVAQGVHAVMEKVREQIPEGIDVGVAYDTSVFVEQAVREVFETLGIAFALVVLTIFVFLRNIRATLLPALSIPVSIIATFGMLYLLGYSINIFTLLAMVLAIGLVVDDAIVVLENIHRHIEEGMAPLQAALTTMNEIAFAIITITLSLVAVFLPLAFLTGITGRLLLEFAMALVSAVVVSAFVALTLSPMAGARVLRAHSDDHGAVYRFLERRFESMNRNYARTLDFALRQRWLVMVLVAGCLGLTWYFYQQLDKEFLPEEDKGWILTIAVAPQGATPEYTDRMVRQMEAIAVEVPEMRGYFSGVAFPFDGPGDPTSGLMWMDLHGGERRSARDIVDGPNGLAARLYTEVEGALAFAILPKAVEVGFSQPYQLVINNPDLRALNGYVEQLLNRLREEGWLANARSTVELTKPELRVRIDRDRAGTLGVSIRDISRTLQILFGGEDLSEIKLDGEQYEVMVQMERSERLTPASLERLFVRNNNGELVQLSNVVSTETGAGPNQIERFQRLRSATIEGTPVGISLGTAVERTEALLAETLPGGFSYDWKGEARDLRESSADIYFFGVLAIIVVYMVLAAQFESIVHPFTVMLALPLAFVGAFGALYGLDWVDHYGTMLHQWVNYAPEHPPIAETLAQWIPRIPAMNLNVFSEVGLVILIGLVTKNSILLVEFANQRMAEGLDAREAMRRAGAVRLRPILMTSLATIAGIAPIAIGFGEAAESRRPLGVVAVGGMVTSTLLTLFVIPVFYTLVDDLRARLGGRRRAAAAAPATSPATGTAGPGA